MAWTAERQQKYYREWRAANMDKIREYDRAWYQANKERCQKKHLDGHLKRKFGISLKEYQAMLVKQNGVCAICQQPPRGKHRLHVDHDHETKRVRALLCHHCNALIGYAEEDVKRLHVAAEYLRKYAN